MPFGKLLLITVFTVGLTASAAAEEPRGTPFEELPKLEETAKQFLNMLQYLVMAIPQYEAPEILENGDIIIRRKPPENSAPEQHKAPPSTQRKI